MRPTSAGKGRRERCTNTGTLLAAALFTCTTYVEATQAIGLSEHAYVMFAFGSAGGEVAEIRYSSQLSAGCTPLFGLHCATYFGCVGTNIGRYHLDVFQRSWSS